MLDIHASPVMANILPESSRFWLPPSVSSSSWICGTYLDHDPLTKDIVEKNIVEDDCIFAYDTPEKESEAVEKIVAGVETFKGIKSELDELVRRIK
ncbi:hypothetical protein QUF76_00175 [Desulfobacterales bacterium HSG16]|nr:hypothetical protein [Desulfobacterales bacterium HSG16]